MDKIIIEVNLESEKLVHIKKNIKNKSDKYQLAKFSEAPGHRPLLGSTPAVIALMQKQALGGAYPLSILWLHLLLTHW